MKRLPASFTRQFGLWLGGWVLATAVAVPAEGQAVRTDTDSAAMPVDSSDVHARARREQARFERLRVRYLPETWAGGGGDCDEIVGRFCFWFGQGDEIPPAEPADLVPVRDEFLSYLDSVQVLVPRDGWVTGQRVWYRTEARNWDRALEAARSCQAERWWCAALEGFALHGLGRYAESEEAYERALAAMDPERAERWRDLDWLLDRGGRGAMHDARDQGTEPDAAARVWAVADPLYLDPGNDRRTEHFARWTVATIREESRNPYGISWGRDMSELTVRMGWEVSWERVRPSRIIETRPSVIGHHRPEGRDLLPRGDDAPLRPSAASEEELQPSPRLPRSLYTPPRAPLILPMEGQLAVFPRGDRLVVVATHYLPQDTAPDPELDSLRRAMRPAVDRDGRPLEPRSGLFLVPEDGSPRVETTVSGVEGTLLLRAPAGRYVVAVEAWAPESFRAGRIRRGLTRDTVPPDVATLSDLLLLGEGDGTPSTLDDAAGRALLRASIPRGTPLAVAWEVNGLGWEPADVRYELEVERTGGNVFRRLGAWMGLTERERPVTLSWSEPGPERPEPVLRSVGVDLGDADPGEYRVVLRARIAGRGILTSQLPLRVEPGPG